MVNITLNNLRANLKRERTLTLIRKITKLTSKPNIHYIFSRMRVNIMILSGMEWIMQLFIRCIRKGCLLK